METLQSTIFIEFDVNTKKITFLRGDNIIDQDSNTTSVYVRVKYKNLSGNTVYLTPSELRDYRFSLYTIKPTTNNINLINGKVTNEFKENFYGGVVKFEIPRTCTNRLGIVKCEIHINQGNKIIASSTFVLDIKQSLVTAFDDELLGDEDFPVLRQLILEMQKIRNIDDNNRSKITTYSSDKIEMIKQDIEENVEENVEKNVENINSQIKEKANSNEVRMKNESITMADLHTDVKAAMTGGSVPVVGENAVGTENIKDYAVTAKKVNFDIVPSTRTLNLFDRLKVDRGKYINFTGASIPVEDGTDRDASDFIYVIEGETYTSSQTFTHYMFYDENYNPITSLFNDVATKSITVPSDMGVKYIRFTVFHDLVNNLSFERGTTATDGTPYVIPVLEPKSIDEDKLSFIPAKKERTSNLFNKDKVDRGNYINSGGDSIPVEDGTDRDTSDFIPVIEGETYTSSQTFTHYMFYGRNYNAITTTYNDGGTKSVTVPSGIGAKYIRFTVFHNLVNTLSFELGTTATDGTPYTVPNLDPKSVDEDKLSFIPAKNERTSNLFNKDTAVLNKYVAFNDGNYYTPSDGTIWAASDFIEIEGNTEYCMTSSGQTAFYDDNKNYISGLDTNLTIGSFVSPTNAKYMKVSIRDNLIDDFQVNKGSTLLKYEPYEKVNLGIRNVEYKNLADDVRDRLNNIEFSNLTANFIGDSITYGFESGTGNRVAKPYPEVVKEILGFKTVNNYAISGTTLAGDTSHGVGQEPLVERYVGMEDNADYIIVASGTNDFGSDRRVPLGTMADSTNTTFYGSLHNLCIGLINKYPNGRIIFTTPLKRAGMTNSEGLTLEQYANAIKEVCAYYSIPVLDLYNVSGFHVNVESWRNIYAPDGLHGTQEWYYKHGRIVANFLKSI